jgi:hypothetical protein
MTREETVAAAVDYADRAAASIQSGLPVEQTQVLATLSLAYASTALAMVAEPVAEAPDLPDKLSQIKEEWRLATQAGFRPDTPGAFVPDAQPPVEG